VQWPEAFHDLGFPIHYQGKPPVGGARLRCCAWWSWGIWTP